MRKASGFAFCLALMALLAAAAAPAAQNKPAPNAPPGTVRETAKKSASPAPPEPIRITAKKMEVKADQNSIIFEEDVVAVQGDITITADRLKIVTQKSEAKAEAAGEATGAPKPEESQIKEMLATGNVQFRQFFPEEKIERFATGQQAHYFDNEGKLVMTGDPKAWENDNVITGETMTFFTRQNLFLVDGKVKVIFYPDKDKGGLLPKPVLPSSPGTAPPPAGSAAPASEKAAPGNTAPADKGE